MTIRTALQGHILLETPGDGGSGAGEPQQGQGADTDLYSPYLADVPAEMHPLVLDPLKRQNADFTRKFQEASQFRQQWEPYQQLGLHEMDPQEIEGLLSFREQISTDDGARQWFSQMAENEEAAKIFPEDAWEKIGVANGWLDEGDNTQDFDEEDPDGPPAWFQEFQQQVTQELAQVRGQTEMAQVQQQQNLAIDAAVEHVNKKYAQQFPEGIPDEIHDAAIAMALGMAQAGVAPDLVSAIEPSFERIMTLRGTHEGDQLEEKLGNGNGATLNGGRPDTNPPKLSWNGGISPRDAALARLKQT